MQSIRKIGVIGAGTMGNGIAQACAVAGLSVTMVDISDDAVQRGVKTLSGSLDRLVKKDKLTEDAKAKALSLVKGSTQYAVIFTFVLLAIVLAVRPYGIFGRPA